MSNTHQHVFHAASSRGAADHGWLKSFHTFSFANYYNPERINFGALRVLNDDSIEGGMGFGTHPHDNMEIISIPLEGALEHRDSMGNHGVIRKGEIQVMSAGTGITHSEFNHLKDQQTKFLQIWIFPQTRNVTPRYDQIHINPDNKSNEWIQLVSPNQDDEGTWIHQNAWFSLAQLEEGKALTYALKGEHTGLYAFVIQGEVTVDGQAMNKRDGLAISGASAVNVQAQSATEILMIEIPLA